MGFFGNNGGCGIDSSLLFFFLLLVILFNNCEDNDCDCR